MKRLHFAPQKLHLIHHFTTLPRISSADSIRRSSHGQMSSWISGLSSLNIEHQQGLDLGPSWLAKQTINQSSRPAAL